MSFLESLEITDQFLSYLGKFTANFEVVDFCSVRIKGLDCFKEVVNNALIKVTTSLIFQNSFLGWELHINQTTANCFLVIATQSV